MRRLQLYPDGVAPLLQVEEDAPRERDTSCDRCALHAGARHVCMAAELVPARTPQERAKRLLVVGEHPGRQEDLHGRPFMGQAGVFVRQELAKVWGGEVVLDSAVKCATVAAAGDKAADACRGYLHQVLADAAPDRVILLGTEAISTFLGSSHPMHSLRRAYAYTSTGIPVFLLPAPVVVVRNRFLRAWFLEDLEWAATCAPPAMPPFGGVVHVVESAEDSAAACARLRQEDWLSFDTETFGAHHDNEFRVQTLGISFPPWDEAYTWERDVLYDPAALAPVKALLEDPKVIKGGQNAKFDQEALHCGPGIKVTSIVKDARLWRKMLQADASGKLVDMQALVGMAGAKREHDEAVAEAVKLIRRQNSKSPAPNPSPDLVVAAGRVAQGHEAKRFAYAMTDPDLRQRYCASDCVSTGLCLDLFEPQIRANPGLSMVWDEITVPMSHAIAHMEMNGLAMDRQAIKHLQVHLQAQLDELNAWFTRYDKYFPENKKRAEVDPGTGKKLKQSAGFNPGSVPQVARLLYDILGASGSKTTQGGGRATDKEALELMSAQRQRGGSGEHVTEIREATTKLLAHRRCTKFKGTYADGMEHEIRDDGRIHPDAWIDGTETGRPACRNPNLMNIPRAETAEGKMCRDLFVAAPGYVILEGDYNQSELRLAAELSGDPVMMELFANPSTDFHLETARMVASMFDVDPADVTKEHWLRSAAKTINFATLYGEPVSATAKKLGITRQRAEDLQTAIFGRFKALKHWIDKQLASGRQLGGVHTYWRGLPARWRPLWRIADVEDSVRETAERSTWNSPIQGSAAEHTNAAVGELQQRIETEFWPSRFVLTVYDSILQEVKIGHELEVARMTQEIMLSFQSKVAMKVDFKVGKAWGSLEKLAL